METSKDDIWKLSRSNSKFAIHLYQALSRTGASENIFFSPISISTALAVTYLGARGNTSTQMGQVLGFNELEFSQLHTTFREFNSMLYNPDRLYKIKSANRLFGQESYTFLPEFLEASAKHYGAQLKAVDFATKTEEARLMINAWVEEQTEGKIKDLLAAGTLDPLSTLVLVNAIYFKGDWASKFWDYATQKAEFFISKESKVIVPMMTQKAKFNFGFDSDLDCQLLELPYVGSHLSMVLILPTKVDGLPQLESKLTIDHLDSWPKTMVNNEITVTMPKFKHQQAFSLDGELASMGISDLFTADQADLSGVAGNKELYVSDVIHKAFIEVNEKGTEAAAATAIMVVAQCAALPLRFTANHPFLFIIRDNNSNAILFIGRYSNPPNAEIPETNIVHRDNKQTVNRNDTIYTNCTIY